MRFTDRKTHCTDCIPLLSIRSTRTDRQTVYNHSCHETILSPTNEMRFTDRKTHFSDRIPLLLIRSIRTDRHMAYTDRYGAGVLDNPHNGHRDHKQATKRNHTHTIDIYFKTSTWKSLVHGERYQCTPKQDVLKQRSSSLALRSICVYCLASGRQVNQYRRPKHSL